MVCEEESMKMEISNINICTCLMFNNSNNIVEENRKRNNDNLF